MIHHLSHTDLDGYSCQLITKLAFPNDNINYLNADYSDITDVLHSLLKNLTKNDVLYITDLNLTAKQAAFVDNSFIKKTGVVVVLLDHHGTGQEQADIYDWYHLDTSISATLATFNYFFVDELGSTDKDKAWLHEFIKYVDTYDMWRKENRLDFNKTALLADFVKNKQIDSPFSQEYISIVLEKMSHYYVDEDLTTSDLEKTLIEVISSTLTLMAKTLPMEKVMSNTNICTTVKLSTFPAESLTPFDSFELFGTTLHIYSDINSGTAQYGFDFLFENDPSYANVVLCKIDRNYGAMMFRSINSKAVEFAKLFGGGGHPNASGAKLNLPKQKNNDLVEISKLIKSKLEG